MESRMQQDAIPHAIPHNADVFARSAAASRTTAAKRGRSVDEGQSAHVPAKKTLGARGCSDAGMSGACASRSGSPADEASSATTTAHPAAAAADDGEPPHNDTEVVIRRYCIIYSDAVPDAYFLPGPGGSPSDAQAEVQAVAADEAARCAAAGLPLARHAYAVGIDDFNVHPDDGEMWCSLPETALARVAAALGIKAECIFEECGVDDDGDD